MRPSITTSVRSAPAGSRPPRAPEKMPPRLRSVSAVSTAFSRSIPLIFEQLPDQAVLRLAPSSPDQVGAGFHQAAVRPRPRRENGWRPPWSGFLLVCEAGADLEAARALAMPASMRERIALGAGTPGWKLRVEYFGRRLPWWIDPSGDNRGSRRRCHGHAVRVAGLVRRPSRRHRRRWPAPACRCAGGGLDRGAR